MAIKNVSIIAKVIDGKPDISPTQRQAFREWYSNAEGKKIEIAIRVVRMTISEQQRRYYWGVIIPYLMEAMGCKDPNWAHFDIKQKIMPAFVKVVPAMAPHPFTGILQEIFMHLPEGEEPERLSITILDTALTEEFFDAVRNWAHDFLNCTIPLPNEDLVKIGIVV